MFVKMYPSPHEELEDIESSDDETEICEIIKTPERSPSKKQKSPRKERKPWKHSCTLMHSGIYFKSNSNSISLFLAGCLLPGKAKL